MMIDRRGNARSDAGRFTSPPQAETRARILHGSASGASRHERTLQNQGMPPLSPTTLTRLDPALPLLWRDDHTLQIGVDRGVRIEVDAAWVELLVSRMRTGFQRRAFDVLAHGLGAPRREARALLARLEAILVDDPPPPPAVWIESVNITDGRTEYRLREALDDEGIRAGDRGAPGQVGVILLQGAASALQLAPYLRDDLPHLPVAFEPGRVTAGPLVVPGSSPCLACRDAHERDRDPAWPRLHAQLIARAGAPISAAQVAEAAVLAASVLRSPLPLGGGQTTVGISANGRREWRPLTFHEECRCRAPSSRSRRGSATVPAPRVLPTATRSPTAFARRA